MKDNEIHQRFDKSEIRDLLSHVIRDCTVKGVKIHEEANNFNISYLTGIEYRIKSCEIELYRYKALLKNDNDLKAALTLIELMGWDEHDVSDNVMKTHNTFYLSFIGTDEEYKQLLSIIDNE